MKLINSYRLQTHSKNTTVSSGVKAAAVTLNVAIDKLDASNGHHQNGSKDSEQNGHARNKRGDEIIHNQQNKMVHQQLQHSHQQQHESSMNRQEESSPTQTSVVKHSLLQFALQHFRYE